MDVPALITQLEPVSECVQQFSAWIEMHAWHVGVTVVLAVIGSMTILDYSMRLVGGLVDRVLEHYGMRPLFYHKEEV